MTADLMPERPRLREYLRLLPGPDPDELTVRGGATAVTLRGRSVSELLPGLLTRLDGSRHVDELAHEMPEVAKEVLLGALSLLYNQRLLADGPSETPPDTESRRLRYQENFWESLPGLVEPSQEKLARSAVSVLGCADLTDTVVRTLSASGVGSLRPDETSIFDDEDSRLIEILAESDLSILCTDDPTRGVASRLNEIAVRMGKSWMLVSIGDASALVGPLVLPRQTSCFECLRLRLLSNDSNLLDRHGMRTKDGPPTDKPFAEPAYPAYFLALVGSMAATEAIHFLSGSARANVVGSFLSLSPMSTLPVSHDVLKVPRCNICGPVRYQPPTKLWSFDTDSDVANTG